MRPHPEIPGYETILDTVPRTVRHGRLGVLSPTTRALWVALHGYGERADLMAARAHWPAAAHRVWLFPEAPHRFYLAEGTPASTHQELPVGASWMTRELRDHDIADNIRMLDALVERALHIAPHASVHILGFSQGGATAVRWAAARAAAGEPTARLVVWGSLLPPDVALGPTTPLHAVPLELVMGTRDRWVSEERFTAELARLADAAHPVHVRRFVGGHRFDDPTLAAVVASTPA
jgi:predicted esterase